MLRKLSMIIFLLIGLTACENEEMPVDFKDINDTDTATFTIENRTGKDVASFTTEITYFSTAVRILKVDTVTYAVKDSSKAFIKAGEKTFLAQQVPEGAGSASAIVLDKQFMD